MEVSGDGDGVFSSFSSSITTIGRVVMMVTVGKDGSERGDISGKPTRELSPETLKKNTTYFILPKDRYKRKHADTKYYEQTDTS